MTRTARLRAFAKLNLGLRVLNKRPDGFHELRTVFQTISLADRIDIAFAPGRKTSITVEGTPEISDNLAGKAARLVLEVLRMHAKVAITLNKKIPLGAGLGGGSSDAAAVLLALPVLAGKVIPAAALLDLSARLGSDVAFFLYGGTALGLGRGEELYPLPDQLSKYVLLIAPLIHSSTVGAYRALSPGLTSIPPQNKLLSFGQELWQGSSAMLTNDFEEVVFAMHPELKRIKARLIRLGAKPAAMTGSGSAIFGVFEDEFHLARAVQSFPNERVFPISFVSRAQYRSAFVSGLKRALPEVQNINLWPLRGAHA